MGTVTFMLTAVLCYIASGMVHELGHVIVGLAHGWKFSLLVIGPLGIKAYESGGIKFYLEKNPAFWGGIGCTYPKEGKEDNIKIWSRVLMTGPLASIAMGAIFLPLGVMTNNLVLLFLGAMPLGMGFVCALPYPLKSGILYTDGGRWSRLRKGGQGAAEEVALFRLTELQLTGNDFAQVDLGSIEALLRSTEPAIRYYGLYYQLRYFKATGDAQQMATTVRDMEALKGKVPAIIVNDCKVE